MKHITEEYGMDTNELTLTWEEYKQLEPFLKKLGVRTRSIISDSNQLTIQGENPYKTWAKHPMCKYYKECLLSEILDVRTGNAPPIIDYPTPTQLIYTEGE